MKLSTFSLALLCLAGIPAFSQDDHHDHDHDHEDAHHHEQKSNLLDQLGFGLFTVGDHAISGQVVTAVPVSSVFYGEGKAFVLIRNEKEPHNFDRWEVVLGLTDGRLIEAKSGVFPGDQIIVKLRPLVSIAPDLEPAGDAPGYLGEPAEKTVSRPTPGNSTSFGVQIGAFSRESNARRVADRLKDSYGRTDVLPGKSSTRSLFRVRVGEYSSRKSASEAMEKLKGSGFPEAFVVSFR